MGTLAEATRGGLETVGILRGERVRILPPASQLRTRLSRLVEELIEQGRGARHGSAISDPTPALIRRNRCFDAGVFKQGDRHGGFRSLATSNGIDQHC